MNNEYEDQIRKALARNRMLNEVLAEDYQPQRDALLRERALAEMHRTADARRTQRRQFGAVAAMIAFVLISAIAFYRNPRKQPSIEVTAPKIPMSRDLPLFEIERPPVVTASIVFEASAPGFEIVHVKNSGRLLHVVTPNSPAPLIQKSSKTALSLSAFAVISSSRVQTNFDEIQPQGGNTMRVALISDAEVLCLPRVKAILGGGDKTRRLVIASKN